MNHSKQTPLHPQTQGPNSSQQFPMFISILNCSQVTPVLYVGLSTNVTLSLLF